MQPQAPYNQPSGPLPPGYEFIHNTSPSPRRSAGQQSPIIRAIFVLGGLLILFIIFTVVKGLFAGGGNKAELVSVVQDQTAIITYATAADTIQTLSTTNKYFTITAQAGITSAKSELLTYMSTNKIKIGDKEVLLKVSATTNQKLSDAAAGSSYDRVYKEVMTTQLNTYQQDLKLAYSKTPGKNGQAILTKQYDAAGLLLKQLDSPAN